MDTSYLLSQCFHGSDVDTATFCIVQQHPQNSKLGTDGLSTSSGSPHKHIIITVVHSVEHWKDSDIVIKSWKQWTQSDIVLVNFLLFSLQVFYAN